jgi:succinate-semialdehyde dehydrogenase/glutarate-semialdehyde dehydrogenase
MAICSVNPATGETIKTYDELTPDQVKRIVDQAHDTFLAWRETPFDERAELMRAVSAVLRDNVEPHAELMACEMGKPLREGRSEIEKCAWVCDYYADNAASFLTPEKIETDAGHSFVTFQPIGVVLAVMPWNFPFWQVFRFAAPSLMAGNAAVLKHASNVPGCALAIERAFGEAGFPHDLFRTLLIGSAGGQVERLIANPQIAAVTLTGSTPAGAAVARAAGEWLKKTVLELGGSDAYVVLEDADLDLAVEACVTGRLINGGQSCIAAKRFIVPRRIREEFESRFVDLMRQKTMGDPHDESHDIGPQARYDLRDDLHSQVQESIASGARCLLGGEIPDRPGAYYPPTVLTDVTAGMPAHDEELFGPVAAIIPVENDDDAIRAANDSLFGLGAAVFTRNIERGERIASVELQAGCCFVNTFVKSDPRLPFGGIKQSGYGRELSHYGIKEFVNVKTVYVK